MKPASSETPRSAVDQAASKAMEVIEWYLKQRGAEARHILVLIHANDVPEGEPNSTAAGHGYEDDRELIAELLIHARQVGEVIGFDVNVIVPEVRGQG